MSLHPLFENILKPHLQGQKVSNRSRYRALESVHAELEAAGVSIDIAQLDWAAKEINSRLYEESLDRQYAYEQYRKAKDADEFERTAPTPEQREEQQRLADEEAEREERRQYRAWRNDSGV